MGSIPYAVSGITGGLGPYTIRDEKTTVFNAVLCLVAQLCPTLCDTMDRNLPGSSVRGDSPGKNTTVGCPALLQGIFPMQGPDLIPAESGFISGLHVHLMGGRGYAALFEIALLLASQALLGPFLSFSHVFQPMLGPQRIGSSTEFHCGSRISYHPLPAS